MRPRCLHVHSTDTSQQTRRSHASDALLRVWQSTAPHRAPAAQVCTQRGGYRPYGLGLLVAGADATGPHLFETCPSGQFWECKAMAMGARSQAAKTYLERKLDEFAGAGQDALISHALAALQVRRR